MSQNSSNNRNKNTRKKSGKPNQVSDPYAKREAKNYDNPIPSREFILDLLTEQPEPINRFQVEKLLKLDDPDQKEGLRRRLRAMERDGQVFFNRRKCYELISESEVLEGIVSAHPDGFGFVLAEDGGGDLFMGMRDMRILFHGDRVQVRVSGTDRKGRREGALVKILEHNTNTVVGQLENRDGILMVVPDHKRINHDVIIAEEHTYGAEVGQMVMVEIQQFPTRFQRAKGRVIQNLGGHMEPGQEIDVAIRSYKIPHEWPIMLEAEIADLEAFVPESSKVGREDFRNHLLLTIDGADAKDFDDAVCCERITSGKNKDGWRLWVAIADVSSYVERGTALDAEAKRRGTSVYFPGRVVPMLPEILSNGLCSLNPDVDRLSMVCEMEISASGEVVSHRFSEGLMRSHARLTYNQVAAMVIDGDVELCEQYANLLPHLHELYQLYKVLAEKRSQRGAIDFETVETQIVFGEDRKIEKLAPITRNDAHRVIEECMLAANVSAANFLLKNKIAALYRNHKGPTDEKLKGLKEFISPLGLSLGGGDEPTAKDYSKLLNEIKERPDFEVLQIVMLRSLSQAVYEAENVGHFGLSFEAYAHFTSPIRRYPDLLVHRAIKHIVRGNKASTYNYTLEQMNELGQHCSITERRADDATRDATDWLKCEYMLDKVGEEFEGRISTVTGFGLFVVLDEIHVEGLIHITALKDDYYHFDKMSHKMKGEHTGKVFQLGDKIRIKVAAVNLDERKIDFVALNAGPDLKRKKDRPGFKKKKKFNKGGKSSAPQHTSQENAPQENVPQDKAPQNSASQENAPQAKPSEAKAQPQDSQNETSAKPKKKRNRRRRWMN
ncbi:ribonuclease R [sulfur-oxidizing endosymbiont of Gigantopelta aegis]|uniref:ribonuclease R n=1 Tax=sulfur-oxidizing endosymbiont of Gigantopelta aegis TaxID=2794934 RepID=UPI0018DCB076|nr:ribonuclease R [sulfur-oxidizing endosymbiont of Gigantopelta aegis]